MQGVSFWKMKYFERRLPSNTLWGTRASTVSFAIPSFSSLARTSPADFPKANASVCAR